MKPPVGPKRPMPTVALEPVDLTTAVGQTPLHVRVSNLVAPVGADLLGRIAKAIVLRTWPELTAVPTVVSKMVDASGRSDQDAYAHIYVTPAEPLSDRWYVLAIDELPQGSAWADPGSLVALANGGLGTRFRVGSAAMVSSVRVYPAKKIVYVDLSEAVEAQSGAVALDYSGGEKTGCRREEDVAPAASQPTGLDTTGLAQPAGVKARTAATSIRLSCAAGLDLQQPIRLDVQLGAKAGTNAAADSIPTQQLTIGPDAWLALPDGGRMNKVKL